jgi:hypothetical protein
MPDPISRRQAITYGVGAVAAGALAGQRGGTVSRSTLARKPRQPWLPQPRVLSSQDGELSVQLTTVAASSI